MKVDRLRMQKRRRKRSLACNQMYLVCRNDLWATQRVNLMFSACERVVVRLTPAKTEDIRVISDEKEIGQRSSWKTVMVSLKTLQKKTGWVVKGPKKNYKLGKAVLRRIYSARTCLTRRKSYAISIHQCTKILTRCFRKSTHGLSIGSFLTMKKLIWPDYHSKWWQTAVRSSI